MNSSYDSLQILFAAPYEAIGNLADMTTVMDSARNRFNVLSSVFLMPRQNSPAESQITLQANIDPYWQTQYNRHYFACDPSFEMLTAKPNTLHIDHVTDCTLAHRQADARKFYHEVMKPQDYAHTAAACYPHANSGFCSVIWTRSRQQGDFGSAETSIICSFSRHLARALALMAKFELHQQKNASLLQLLEQRQHGVATVDAQGRILECSTLFTRYLAQTPELRLERGILRSTHQRLDQQLSSALRTAIHQGTAAAPLRLTSNAGHRLEISVSPCTFTAEFTQGLPETRAMVVITQLHTAASSRLKAFATQHALTPSETQILELLVAGQTVTQIVVTTSRRINTVKTHMKGIFAKLDVHSQIELLRLLSSSGVLF